MFKIYRELRCTLKLLESFSQHNVNIKNVSHNYATQLTFIRFRSTNTNPQVFPSIPRKKPVTAGTLFLLVIPAAAFGLGTWQIQRLRWKEALIEELQSKINMGPIDLPEDLSELDNLEYRKVKLQGRFDHANEIYFGPKPLIANGDVAFEGLISKTGQRLYGYLVVTPFILSGSGERILVNRGWVETKNKSPSKRLQGQVEGEQTIIGVVRKAEQKRTFSPDFNKKFRIWYYRDIAGMAEETGTLPVYVDATVESSIPNIITAGQTKVVLRNEHLSYIITWYSLSAATAFMWYRYFIHG